MDTDKKTIIKRDLRYYFPNSKLRRMKIAAIIWIVATVLAIALHQKAPIVSHNSTRNHAQLSNENVRE